MNINKLKEFLLKQKQQIINYLHIKKVNQNIIMYGEFNIES